jgi:uncharacterized coiled-coil DUF342 family protein
VFSVAGREVRDGLPEAPEEKLEELVDKASALRQERERLRQESKKSAEKRDKLHKQIKDLGLEIGRDRERRNALNRKVKELKTQRDESRDQTRLIAEEIGKLNQKMAHFRSHRPKQHSQVLKQEKERIEWRIQTTSLSLEEEKPLVKRANQLESQLKILRRIGNLEAEVGQLICRRNVKERDAAQIHAQLSELAQQSQELHKRMMLNAERKEGLQAAADQHHQDSLDSRLAAQQVNEACARVGEQIGTLEKEIVEDQETKRKLRQEELRKKLRAKASEKLKQGEKLTFAEFKLLTEDE